MPLLFFFLYVNMGLSRGTIFSGYATFTALLYAAWAVLFVRFHSRPKLASAAPPTPAKEEAQSTGSTKEVEAPKQQGADELHADEDPIDNTIAPLGEGASMADAFSSRQYLLGLFWFIANGLHSNLYLGEAKYMLESLGDADGLYMKIFTGSLTAAVVFIQPISAVIDKLGLAKSMQAVNALALLHALLALAPTLHVQGLTFVVFTVYRAATFAVWSVFIVRVFGIAKLGRLLGTGNGLGAIVNLAIPYVAAAVLEYRGGDWSVVLVSFALLCGPQYSAVALLESTTKGSGVPQL